MDFSGFEDRLFLVILDIVKVLAWLNITAECNCLYNMFFNLTKPNLAVS